MRRLPAPWIAAPAVILFVLLGARAGGAQETPEAQPVPVVEEPASESQGAESDRARVEPAEPSSPDSSERERGRPPRRTFREPSLDLTAGERAFLGIVGILLFGLFSVLLFGIVAFVFAPLVARRESRWRSPAALALRWALIGSLCTTIAVVAYEADYSARRSHYMQRYRLSAIPLPERSLSDTFWDHFGLDFAGASTMIVCGFVFTLGGLWIVRRRRAKTLRSAREPDTPAESSDA